MNELEHEVDPPCVTCGGRIHSGCVCPRREPTPQEIRIGRVARLTRAELEHALRERSEDRI